MLCWTMTQGSSFLATLGWRTQSLWDWPERGCGEAQPQHIRALRHVVMISNYRRLRTRCDRSCGHSRAPRQPQRGCVPKPRVARHELPWETSEEDHNPNGVVANVIRPSNQNGIAATALRLMVCWTMTQGRRWRANLGLIDAIPLGLTVGSRRRTAIGIVRTRTRFDFSGPVLYRTTPEESRH